MSIQHIHAKVRVDITFSTIIHARAGTVFMQIPSCKLLGSEVKKAKKLKTSTFFPQKWQFLILHFCERGRVTTAFVDE